MTETSIRTDSGSDPNRISEADIQNGLPHTYGRTDVEIGSAAIASRVCNAARAYGDLHTFGPEQGHNALTRSCHNHTRQLAAAAPKRGLRELIEGAEA